MKTSLTPHTAVLCLTSLLMATPSFAATTQPDEAATRLPEVVVTASRSDENITKTLSSVTVIDREALDRYPSHDLSEVLRFEAGLDVVRQGGWGGQTSIFTRGTESNHTLVMIDGVRINPSTSSIANIQDISLSDVERIEVVKGSLSSLYGSEAIGGVINIITKNPEKTALRVSATAGSDKLAKGSITQSLNNGAFSALIDVSGLYTDGYDIIQNLSLPRGQRTENGGLKLAAQLGDTLVSVQGRSNRGTTEYYNFGTPATQDFTNDLVSLSANSQLSENFSTQLRLSQMRDQINQNESPSFARTEEQQVDWQNNWKALENLAYVLGATLTKTAANYDNGFGTTYDKNEKKTGIYVQQKFAIAGFDTQLAGRLDDYESFGHIATGNIAIGYSLNANNLVYANAGTGYHAPDLNDLYGYGGNPLLKAEESISREIGSRHTFGSVTLNTALYKNDIKNLITCVGGYPCSNVNIDKANIRGVDIGLRWASDGLFAGLTGSVLRAIDESTNTDLLRRPRRNMTLEAGFADNHWGASAQTQASGHSMDAGSRRVPGYAVVNVQAWWQATQELRLQLNVDNIGDKVYGQSYQAANTLYLGTPLSTYLTATLNF